MTEAASFELPPGNFDAWCLAYSNAIAKRVPADEKLATLERIIIQKGASARAIAAMKGNAFDDAAMREIAVLEDIERLLMTIKAHFAEFPTKVQKILRREE